MRYNLFAILSITCLLASCSADGDKDMFDVDRTGYTLFEADFEAVDMDGDNFEGVWDKDLAIGVFGSEAGENVKYTLKNAYDGKTSGEFYGPVVKGEQIMAYYPYSEGYALYDGGMSYTLSSTQVYVSANTLLEHFCANAGCAFAFNNSDNKLKFGYAAGLLSIKFGFNNPINITAIELVSENNNIAGVAKLNPDMSVAFGAGAVKAVGVNFGQGIMSKNDDGFAQYPIVLAAGQYESLKLIVKAEGYDDIICVLDPFEIERISVGDYKLTEVVVSVGGLGGFEIEGGLDFE